MPNPHAQNKPTPKGSKVWGSPGGPELRLLQDLFQYQRKIGAGAGGEIQLTDAMQSLAQNSTLYSWTFHGKRYDIGTMKDWFQSHIELSANSDFLSILEEIKQNL